MKKTGFALATLSILTIFNIAQAADSAFELDPVVVTATRTPIRASQVNANVNVITKDEIARANYHDLSQALKTIPGIDMVNFGDVGFESSNAIRINGTDQILILVDGIRVNLGHLTVPINQMIDMDMIEQIEVVKGSTSVLYGSGAKGGVINIITKKPDAIKTKVSASLGTFGKENYRLNHQGAKNGTYWMVNAQKDILGDAEDGKGNKIQRHLNAEAATVKVGHKFGEDADVSLSFENYSSDTMNSGSVLKPAKNIGEADSHKLTLNYKQKLSDKATNDFTVATLSRDYTYQGNRFKGRTLEIKDQVTSQLAENNRLSVGVEYNGHKFNDYGMLDSVANHNVKEVSVFAQDEWDISSKFNLTLGARYTHHSQAGSNVSPNVNLSYKPEENTKMYVSYNSHFISPSALTLYCDYGMEFMGMYFPLYLPNPNLKPEKGHTIEFGISHDFDADNRVSAHVYRRKSTDVIEMVTDMETFADKAENIDEEKATGFDIQFNRKLAKYWNAFVGYSYTNVDSSAFHGKNRDGMIPKGTVNVGASYVRDNYDLNLACRYVIDRNGPYKESFPKNNYMICDLSANYKVNKAIRAFARINNIFDTYYAEQTNYTSAEYGTPYDYYTAPGRNFVVGIEYSF